MSWPIASNFLELQSVRLGSRSWRMRAHRFSLFALPPSLTSPGGIGAESDSESILTLDANDSMTCSFTSVRWNSHKHCELNVREGHTWQLSRIEQRDLATDLSGPNPPGESLTPRSNSAVADGVGLKSDSFSSGATLGSGVSSRRATTGSSSGRPEVPRFSEGTVRSRGRNNHVHVLSAFPPCGIEGVDGEGWTPSSSSLRPLPTATSISKRVCESLWLDSPLSMPVSPSS